eukprot:TRINITY_DN3218_c0_g1_i4.p1 TRINITY_DN3218_c0_g1~~TRINITY_DN3218_c0_g1_i4.p1  ORF type:complete len:265 (+),score=75.94 TRINITY_DN3218_c0_g1_i4:247-1041(+)
MDSSQLQKAVEALLDYKEKKDAQSKKSTLVESSDPISVQFAFKAIPERVNKRPTMIRLPTPLYSDEDAKVCLIVKDPQRKVKDILEGQPKATNVEKVLALSKLRKRYKQFDDKKQLCSQYDVFLADEAVQPMLAPLTGKTFYSSKKMPIPIDMRTKKKLLTAIESARNSTVFYSGAGACSAVKAATTDFSAEEIVANIQQVVDGVVEATAKKWKNIRSIHVKTHDSIALPVFDSDASEGKKRSADEDTPKNTPKKRRKKATKKA